MKIRDLYDTAPFMKNNITMKGSEGRHRRRHTHLVNAKKGRKNGRKRKKKNRGTTQSQQQQQQIQQPTKELK